MYYVRLFTKPEPLDIIADRQRYWEEVTDKDIYKFYSNRRDIKKDRVEAVNVNKFETKLIIKSENDTQIINPQFFLNLKKIDGNLTHADSVKEISKYKVYYTMQLMRTETFLVLCHLAIGSVFATLLFIIRAG